MANEHVVVNNVFAQLAIGIDENETSIALTSGHGVRIPEIAAPRFMFADLLRTSTGELERVKVTVHDPASDSVTVKRGEDGSAPLTFIAGDTLAFRIGRSDMDQMPRIGLTEVSAIETGTVQDAYEAANALVGVETLPDNFMIILIGADPNAGDAPTLEFSLGPDAISTGAKTIVKGNNSPLAGGDITPQAWLMYRQAWDAWVLQNPFYGEIQSGDFIESASVRTTRAGYLRPDGSDALTGSFLALRNALTQTNTITVTIASPAVVTWAGHGLPDQAEITLETTASLPTGLGPLVKYYVKVVDANTFELSLTPGGPSINTSGTQAGVHTARYYPFGAGDGSTTFTLPDVRGRSRVGLGQGQQVGAADSDDVDDVADTFTVPLNKNKWITGMKVQLATSIGDLPAPLATGTDYWIIRASDTTIKFATTLANAQNGTAINLTDKGSGFHTFTHTFEIRELGDYEGEEAHAMTPTELVPHTHTRRVRGTGGPASGGAVVDDATTTATPHASEFTTGGNQAMNNMSPFVVTDLWIKT